MTSVLNAIQEEMMSERSTVRILIVDDFGPWCRYVISGVQTNPEWAVVGAARNGNEAVLEAQELRPDLILMDVNLPGLDGIAAARLIRKLSPGIRIVFVSIEADPHLAREAFRAGGLGYVVKTDAPRDLFAAIDAAVKGKRYVSSSLVGYGLTELKPE